MSSKKFCVTLSIFTIGCLLLPSSASAQLFGKKKKAAAPASDQTVTLSLESYNTLLNRMEKMEQRLATVESDGTSSNSTASNSTSNRSSSAGSSNTSGFSGKTVSGDYAKAVVYDDPSVGWFAAYEAAVLKPGFSSNVAGTIHDTNLLGAGETSFTHEFPSEFTYSSRFEMGYAPQNNGWGFRTRYWQFNHDVSTRIGANGTTDIEANFADDPDIDIDDNGLGILARQRTEVMAFDLEATTRSDVGNLSLVRGAGLRYGEVTNTGYWSDLRPTGERVVLQNEFTGLGPTVFLEATKPLSQFRWGKNLSLYAKTRGSVLAGSQDLLMTADSNAATPAPNDVIQVSNRMGFVPVAEVQLGAVYSRPTRRGLLELRAGWEAQAWFNSGVAGANEAGGGDSDDFQAQRTADMLLTGFIFGVKMTF